MHSTRRSGVDRGPIEIELKAKPDTKQTWAMAASRKRDNPDSPSEYHPMGCYSEDVIGQGAPYVAPPIVRNAQYVTPGIIFNKTTRRNSILSRNRNKTDRVSGVKGSICIGEIRTISSETHNWFSLPEKAWGARWIAYGAAIRIVFKGDIQHRQQDR